MMSSTSRPASRPQEVHGDIAGSMAGHCQRCRVQALSAASRASCSSCQGLKSWHQLEASSEFGRLNLSHGLPHCGSRRSHGSTSENLTTIYTIITRVMMEGHLHHWEADSMSSIPLSACVNMLMDTFDCQHSWMRSWSSRLRFPCWHSKSLGITGSPPIIHEITRTVF